MNALRIVGLVVAVVGVAAAVCPHWFGPLTGGPAPAADLFEAVERRVRGGMVLGVGLVLVAVTALRPWSVSVPSAIFYFITGALAARVLGIVLDGTSAKQWLWVSVEAVVLALIAAWLWRASAPGA